MLIFPISIEQAKRALLLRGGALIILRQQGRRAQRGDGLQADILRHDAQAVAGQGEGLGFGVPGCAPALKINVHTDPLSRHFCFFRSGENKNVLLRSSPDGRLRSSYHSPKAAVKTFRRRLNFPGKGRKSFAPRLERSRGSCYNNWENAFCIFRAAGRRFVSRAATSDKSKKGFEI